MMLGWPSPTYPKLLLPEAEIKITLDQSAMIAGMLMAGYAVSMLFGTSHYINNKIGLVICSALTCSGWILIYFAINMSHLCLSRFCIGFASGLGITRFKIYTNEIFNPKAYSTFTKNISIFISLGMVISFAVGPFVTFREFALIATVLPTISFVTFLFIPQSPKKFYIKGKFDKVARILTIVNGHDFVEKGMDNIKDIVEMKTLNLIQLMKNRHGRRYLLILTLVILLQQFSGGPSFFAFSEILFTEFKYSRPYICSIIYVLVHFIFTFINTKYTIRISRKSIMMLSLIVSSILSAINALYLYYLPEGIYTVIPLTTMLFYVIFYTSGLSVVPVLLVNDVFDAKSKNSVNSYLQACTVIFAIIVTKIFQVFYSVYGMYMAFIFISLCSGFGLFAVIFYCE